MILTLFIITMSSIAFSMFLALNPMSMGMMILMMSLVLAMTFSYSMSSWVAFLIFLIYIGGMLVMFSYFVALISNQNLYIMNIMLMMTLSIISLSIISYIMNMNIPMNNTYNDTYNILYSSYNIIILMILASILLYTMIMVVKLTSLSKGPLRPFINYV